MQQTTSQNINPGQTNRITVDEIVKRQQSGEKFTFIDVRNPKAWAESDSKLPQATSLRSYYPVNSPGTTTPAADGARIR